MSPERTVIGAVLIQLAEKDSDESFSRWMHNISDLESAVKGYQKTPQGGKKKKKFSIFQNVIIPMSRGVVGERSRGGASAEKMRPESALQFSGCHIAQL